MSTRNMLRMAAVMVAAVLAGLLAVQGTWALWNVSVASGAQSVQSADFQININGKATIIDGQSVTISLADAGPLVPGQSALAAVNVTVPTNAGADFIVDATLGEPSISNQALASHLRVERTMAPPSQLCASADWTKPAVAQISKGGAAAFCVRLTLSLDAPLALRGESARIDVPVTVVQKAN